MTLVTEKIYFCRIFFDLVRLWWRGRANRYQHPLPPETLCALSSRFSLSLSLSFTDKHAHSLSFPLSCRLGSMHTHSIFMSSYLFSLSLSLSVQTKAFVRYVFFFVRSSSRHLRGFRNQKRGPSWKTIFVSGNFKSSSKNIGLSAKFFSDSDCRVMMPLIVIIMSVTFLE